MKKSLHTQIGNSILPSDKAVAPQSETFTGNGYSQPELLEILNLCLYVLGSVAYETCSTDKLLLALFPIENQIKKLTGDKRTRYEKYFNTIVLFMDNARNQNPMRDFFG